MRTCAEATRLGGLRRDQTPGCCGACRNMAFDDKGKMVLGSLLHVLNMAQRYKAPNAHKVRAAPS